MTDWSNAVASFSDGIMKISGERIPVKRGALQHGRLRFWPNNPRIYSIVHASDEILEQSEIEKELHRKDHVKALHKAIKHHGGLIHPLVVVDGSFEVIEGNSRLAAIRLLCKNQPVKYGAVDCIVLPKETTEKVIYSYLHEEHISGKTEWSTYEQAGVIFRLIEGGMTFEALSTEMNIGARKAKSMYAVYKFMVEHGDDKPSRYSYYDVYLSNRKAKARRQVEPALDARVADEIRTASFTAQEFRSMLPHVMSHDRAVKAVVEKGKGIQQTFDTLKNQGKTENLVQKLSKTRELISGLNKDDFDNLSARAQKTAEFELSRIISLAQTLRKKVYG